MRNLDFVASLDAVAQAELVRRKEIAPHELLEAYERRFSKLNPLLRAVVTSDLVAARARIERGVSGPLAGVPFLFKDVVAYPGMRWAIGSRLFATNIAVEGSAFTTRVDEAGLVTVGKTATPEFGLLGSTESLLEGVTHNPWDLSVSPAGSSGGAAAAVASGLVPLAHANDAGGSIRVPASACGVFGLKPSRGRTVATSNVESDFANLVSDLCVSRSVRDSALFLSIVEAGELGGLTRVGHVREPSKRRLRVGTLRTTLLGAEPEHDVAVAFEETTALCRELGHDVTPAPAPSVGGPALSRAFFATAGAGISQMLDMMSGMLGRPVGEGDVEPFTLALASAFRADPGALETARATFAASARAYDALLEQFDVVLTPTLAVSPYPVGHLSPVLDREELIRRTERAVGYTPIHNVAGSPAMSVPLHVSARGLPIGSHFAARRDGEATLLSLAYELEEARPWDARWPRYSYPNLASV